MFGCLPQHLLPPRLEPWASADAAAYRAGHKRKNKAGATAALAAAAVAAGEAAAAGQLAEDLPADHAAWATLCGLPFAPVSTPANYK